MNPKQVLLFASGVSHRHPEGPPKNESEDAARMAAWLRGQNYVVVRLEDVQEAVRKTWRLPVEPDAQPGPITKRLWGFLWASWEQS